jgi:hypothetical protein
VDDAAMHRWFEPRVRDGRWPPVDPQGALIAHDDDATGTGDRADA